MEISMIAINVQEYGDFDVAVTVAIMVAPEGMHDTTVAALCNDIETSHRSEKSADKAIDELRAQGFKAFRTMDLTVGGDL
jgi:hypothetical protein